MKLEYILGSFMVRVGVRVGVLGSGEVPLVGRARSDFFVVSFGQVRKPCQPVGMGN